MQGNKRSHDIAIGPEWIGGPSLDVELIYPDEHCATKGWKAMMTHQGILGPFKDRESIANGEIVPIERAADSLLRGDPRSFYCAVVDPIANGRSVGAETRLLSPKWLKGAWMSAVLMPQMQVEYVIDTKAYLYGKLASENYESTLLAMYKSMIGLCRALYRQVPFRCASIQSELVFEHELEWSGGAYITVPLIVSDSLNMQLIGRSSRHGIFAV